MYNVTYSHIRRYNDTGKSIAQDSAYHGTQKK